MGGSGVGSGGLRDLQPEMETQSPATGAHSWSTGGLRGAQAGRPGCCPETTRTQNPHRAPLRSRHILGKEEKENYLKDLRLFPGEPGRCLKVLHEIIGSDEI